VNIAQMQIPPPIRPSDFINSHTAAPLEWTEEIVAVDRIHLAHVQSHVWGFALKLNCSERFKKWWFDRTDVRRLFSLYAAELDRYGTHALIARLPGESAVCPYAAVCPWTALPQAAEELRTTHIGAEYWESQAAKETILPAFVSDITAALALRESPPNTRELPAFCRLKWGVLLRLGPDNVDHALDYLAIDKPSDCSSALTVNLGANCFAVCLFSPPPQEPLRIGLCRNWHLDLAVKDTTRWLRTFTLGRKQKDAVPT
jgi:hypothetical protein